MRSNERMCIVGLIGLMLLFSGCMKQVQVTYVPPNSDSATVQDSVEQIACSEVYSKVQDPVEALCDDSPQFTRDKELKKYLYSWKGVKYRRGGTSPRGVDCSGLTKLTYKSVYGVELPRTVAGQSQKGVRVDKSSLLPGDLVFFKTGLRSRHVGIYIGNNQFIHASLSKGVTSSSLDNSYWRRKFWQAKRYPQTIRKKHEKILFKG